MIPMNLLVMAGVFSQFWSMTTLLSKGPTFSEQLRIRLLNDSELKKEQHLTNSWLRELDCNENISAVGESFIDPGSVSLVRHGTYPVDLLCRLGGPVSSDALVFSTAQPVLSAAECAAIAAESEAAMGKGGGSSFTLTESNNDVHVRDLANTRRWLGKALPSRLQPLVEACFPAAFQPPRTRAAARSFGAQKQQQGSASSSSTSATTGTTTTQPRLCVYDALVIRYEGGSMPPPSSTSTTSPLSSSSAGGEPQHQPTHSDFSLLSLNIALNDPSEYCGGGTLFEWGNGVVDAAAAAAAGTAEGTGGSDVGDVGGASAPASSEPVSSSPSTSGTNGNGKADTNKPVVVRQGHALVHASALRHAGHGVSKGKRLILVLFLTVAHEQEEEETTPTRRTTQTAQSQAAAAAAAAATAGDDTSPAATTATSDGIAAIEAAADLSSPPPLVELQSDVCHSRRCKRRGVDLSMKRFSAADAADTTAAASAAEGGGGGGGSVDGGASQGENKGEVAGSRFLEDALKEYLAALAFNPRDHELHHYMGICLWQLGKRQEAEEAFCEAVEMNPRDKRPYNNLGVMALEDASVEDEKAFSSSLPAGNEALAAASSFSSSSSSSSSSSAGAAATSTLPPSMHPRRLHHSLAQGHVRRAHAWFRTASAVDPYDGGAALNVGVALLRLDEDRGDEEELEEDGLGSGRCGAPAVGSGRGRERGVQGGEAVALAHFEAAALAHPNHAQIASALGSLRRSQWTAGIASDEGADCRD